MNKAKLPSIDFNRLGPKAGTRVAVVGGCGGIGRALVEAGEKIGLEIAILDLANSIASHPPPETCLTAALDATDENSVNAAFRTIETEWHGLDVMINLCGFANAFTPVTETTLQSWMDVTNGNLRTAFLCARAALPLMQKSQGASIVNTASGLAYKGMPGTASYGAGKAGVIALSKSLSRECAPNIRVNVIAPGAVDTAFLRGGTSRGGEDKDKSTNVDLDHYASTTPLNRLAVADDVVGPILFLSGDAARFITGQVIHINGGGYLP